MDQNYNTRVRFQLFTVIYYFNHFFNLIYRLSLHITYLLIKLFIMKKSYIYLKAIPIEFWILTILWPILLIIFNEIYKVFEIK